MMRAPPVKKVIALLSVCLLAATLPGCTGPASTDRSKNFPLAVTGSMFVPGILLATAIDQAATGTSFLALKVRMENRGGSIATAGAPGFKVVIDNDGYPCDFLKDTEADPRFDGQNFGIASIPPGSYAEGWMVFAVPVQVKSINNGELRFSDKALLGDGAYSKANFAPSSAKRYENISERFTLEARSMTITYKYPGDGNTVVTPSADSLFAVCDLVITNRARKKVHLYVTSDNIVFVSSQKVEYVRGEYSTAPDSANPLKGQDIQAASSARGLLIYEVPTEDSYMNRVLFRFSAAELYSCSIPKDRIDIEANRAPEANITSPDTGFIDTDVLFDAANSSDPDGDPITWLWDFGDNRTGQDTSTFANATYRYPVPGLYTVTLKVKDIGGLEGTAARNIRIVHYFSMKEAGHGIETDGASYYKDSFYVNVTLTNNANRTRSIPSSLFQLRTSDGTLVDWAGDDGTHPDSLAPLASATWKIYFTVPAGKVPVTVIFDGTVTVTF